MTKYIGLVIGHNIFFNVILNKTLGKRNNVPEPYAYFDFEDKLLWYSYSNYLDNSEVTMVKLGAFIKHVKENK